MRKYLSFLLIIVSFSAFSQGMSVSGNVQDTLTKTPLQYAVAMAVRINDSLLLAHTRTDANGRFELKNLPIDTLAITISHSRFGEQIFYLFGNENNTVFDFGKIVLPEKTQQLNEVVIYAFKDPIYYNGDTLVYAADSFKVRPNATVEDLLRKLPGIKVDAQGKVSSQGKEISQVLVDGDEFFGNDPTVATKNLAANGVESVQVYEKKNENATDGGDETVKVMNLKLKEEAKKGYFGKASAASDFQKFYEGELLANKFSKAQKISVFALGSNTPRSNFGWEDMYKYGLNNGNYSEDEDGIYSSNNNNQNQGIPKTLKSGFHYSDKLGAKTKLSFNYTYNTNELKASGATKSQYFLADTSYITDNASENLQKSDGHVLNFKLIQTIDSLTELYVEPKLTMNKGSQENFQLSKFVSSDGVITRATQIKNTNKAEGYDLNTKAILNRKFKKKNRLLRVIYNLTLNDNKSDGFLKSFNTFYNLFNVNDTIDQQKINTSNTQTNNTSATYTEPLSKKIKLEFEYRYNNNRAVQNKKTQKYFNGEYTVYDSSLTNNFENIRTTNHLGAKFIYETKKHFFNVGARIRNVEVTNTNLITQTDIKQSVNNILPYMGYRYRVSENAGFSFNYSTSSSQPSINQLQPIPDNNNPNRIFIGNPDLLPTFSNNFSASYSSFKPISGKNFWASTNFSNTNNAFANSVIYDNLGRTVSKTLNVNGNYNGNVSVSGNFPIFSRSINIRPSAGMNYNSYSGFINSQKNITKALNPNLGLRFNLNLDTVSFSIGYSFDYTLPSSSLSNASNKPYSEHQLEASFYIILPLKFLFETDAGYHINSQRAEGYNINYILWNASISKSFLKNENLILSINGNDILNQNISTERIIQDNVITDNKTNIISRYFLLKLTYN